MKAVLNIGLFVALGKSKFAKELADELDMLYVPPVSMEDFYINPDGYDLRELDHKFHYPR
jgi:NADH dehydrogenase (ubiquinone) 1 alpha subcomplex subunit 10